MASGSCWISWSSTGFGSKVMASITVSGSIVASTAPLLQTTQPSRPKARPTGVVVDMDRPVASTTCTPAARIAATASMTRSPTLPICSVIVSSISRAINSGKKSSGKVSCGILVMLDLRSEHLLAGKERLQGGWDANRTVSLLMVFKNRDDYARHRTERAVQGRQWAHFFTIAHADL
ncbi:unannotated protein [freshwater metagenome]|uniref:Unannotated protein n=1 Tax=freshwater metagenome TaxID=449393 RepID=A0A6J7QJJ4_9ZZZZ